MLDGKLSIIEGSRQLASLRSRAEIDDFDPDFLPFVGIDSETDSFPIGNVRRYWAKESLFFQDIKIAAAEAHFREYALSACRRTVARFGNEKPLPEDYNYYTPEE